MYSVSDVANEFLSIKSMTHKKLQKLCYYAQGWSLGLTGELLFREKIEAWIHGPVCPYLYSIYKIHGYYDIPTVKSQNTDSYLKKIVEQVYRIYEDLDGDDLEVKTHKEDPWIQARGNLNPWDQCNNEITKQAMHKYFDKEFKKIANA